MSLGLAHLRSRWATLGGLIALTAVPLLVSEGANWLLQINGCWFDVKSGTRCLIGGSDWGPVLGRTYLWSRAVGGAALWVVTLPGIVIWIVALGVKALRQQGRARERLASRPEPRQ